MARLLRALVVGWIVWGCLGAATTHAEPARADATPPVVESDAADSQSMLPIDGAPPGQIDSAAQLLIKEGDRLAGLKEYREAIHFYSSAMQLAPRDPSLHIKRSQMYRSIGEAALAEQDLRIAVWLAAPPQAAPPEPLELFPFAFPLGLDFDPAMAPTYGAAAWLVLTLAYCIVAFRQSREGGGTIRRLIGVAAAASLVALAPLFVWLAAKATHHDGDLTLLTAFPLISLSVVWMALVLRPPHRPYSNRPPLPLVENKAVLASVGRLAEAMGIKPPQVRLIRSVGGAQRVLAWAGGLPAPTILVTDGLLHRLDDVERDAVIAHEMAHIANHSLWPLSSVFSVSCAVAMLAAIWHPMDIAMAFGFAAFIGLRRIVSRPIEADCDRRAGRAMGFDCTISALKKIHALHSIRSSGRISLVAYAWATHPSPEMRLNFLARAARRESASGTHVSTDAPCNDKTSQRPESTCPEHRFRLSRAISWLGVVLWFGSLCAAWQVAPMNKSLAFWLLMVVACMPIFLLTFARTAATKRAASRQRIRPLWQRLLPVAGVLLLICLPFVLSRVSRMDGLDLAFIAPVMIVVAFLALTVGSRRNQGVNRQINVALQEHRFGDVLAIARMNRKQIARQPLARYNVAFVEGLHGDRSLAIAELEELCRKYRSFALPALTLCVLYFEEGDNERALDVARRASDRWPKDPLPRIDEARVLRQLGRLDEAQAAIEQALWLDADAGAANAVAAGISLDRGDLPAAQRLAERAIELEPGGLLALVANAEIVLAVGNREQASVAVERAAKTIRANPFALCGVELARLEQKLAEWDAQQLDVQEVAN